MGFQFGGVGKCDGVAVIMVRSNLMPHSVVIASHTQIDAK